MSELEDLVRRTLADPRRRLDADASLRAAVQQRTDRLRSRRSRWLAAGTVAGCAVLLTVVALGRLPGTGGDHPAPVSGTRASTSAAQTSAQTSAPAVVAADGATGPDVALPHLPPVDVHVAGDRAWILAGDQEQGPGWLMVLDRRTGNVLRQEADRHGAPLGLNVDPAAGSVWVWSRSSDGTSALVQYDAGTLAERRSVQVPGTVFDAVELDGQLWVATGDHLLRLPRAGGTALRAEDLIEVPGGTGAFALATDTARHRVIVSADTYGVFAVDDSGTKVASASQSLFKTSLALTGDGRLWLAGYTSADTATAVQLDPVSLRTIGTTAAGLRPGSIVWPGRQVVWVRAGGSEELSCIDSRTGAVLQIWRQLQGPVAGDGQDPPLAVTGYSLRSLLLDGGPCGG